MTAMAAALACAIGVTALLSAAGDLLLVRRATRLSEAFDSFLAGLAAAAGALFPLTLIAGKRAFSAVVGALIAAGAARIALRRRLGARERERSERPTVVAWVTVALLAAVVGIFTLRVMSNRFGWDGIQIWAAKARVLFVSGALTRRLWVTDEFAGRIVLYPPALPLMEALVFRPMARFHFLDAKAVFPIFYLALLLAVFRLTRHFASREASLLAALGAATLPTILYGGVGGYCDLPLAVFVAASAEAAIAADSRSSRTLPWLIGGMLMMKDEGIILLACGALVLAAWRRSARLLSGKGTLLVGAFLLDREAYRFWTGWHDIQQGPLDLAHLLAAPARILPVARLCAGQMLGSSWGIFWPLFAASAAMAFAAHREGRARALAVFVVLVAVTDASIYLVTNLDVAYHVTSSYSRLLAQVAPAGVAVIAAVLAPVRATPTS